MNTAGLPGTGLGGLFYLALALWAPVAEVWAISRGRGDRRRWGAVAQQFLIALGVLAAVLATIAVVHRSFGLGGFVLAWGLLPPVLLATLTLGLQAWAELAGARGGTGSPAEVRARRRA